MSVQNLLKTRHKWKSFSQKIAEITVNINTDFELSKELPKKGENGSFFDDALRESMQTNLDPQYSRFVSQILNYTNTLELLLFNKDKVIGALEEFLSLTYEEARAGINTVMYLLQQLARDLRSEFYPYFTKILELLIKIFEPTDPEFIDNFFKCIVFMINFLKQQIVNDFENIFTIFVTQLFTHRKAYTRRLAAETSAFLLRQTPNQIRPTAFNILLSKCQKFYETIKDIPQTEEEISHGIPTTREMLVESIAITISHSAKNKGGTLRSYAVQIVDWCFAEQHEIVNDAFLLANKKLAKHFTKGNDIVPILTEKLPLINPTLALETLSIWTSEKEGTLIEDKTKAIDLLNICLEVASNDSIVDYLKSLEFIPIPEDKHPLIGRAIIKLIINSHQIDNLDGCVKISYAARQSVLEFYAKAPEYLLSILHYIQWLRPSQADVPKELYEMIRQQIKENRNIFIPVLEYIYNRDIYNDLLNLPNKSLEEREVLYTLMGHFDSEKLAEEPPKLLKELQGRIMEEKAISIFSKLITVSKEVNASWFTRDSPFFKQFLKEVDFNTPNNDIIRMASTILVDFVGQEEPLELLEDEFLVVRCGDLVFNAKHDLTSYRVGEAAIARLTTDIVKIRNTNLLMNYALGFARQNYVNFKTHASTLIGSIIKLKPTVYGTMISNEIEKQFSVAESPAFTQALIQGLISAEYIDETMVNLLIKYSEVRMDDTNEEEDQNENEEEETEKKREDVGAKIISQLISSLSSVRFSDKFAEKVDQATFKLLRSTKLEVRKAALGVQYAYHVTNNKSINDQIGKIIQEILESYADPKNKVDTLMRLQGFVESLEFEKEFVITAAVNLTIGCYFEYLTEKVRQKHKYHQLAASMLQSLSFLSPNYTKPLIEATFPQEKSQATLRKAPVYISPVLSRLPNQIYPFAKRIANTLKDCMNACSKASTNIIKACVKAVTLFIETEVKQQYFNSEIEWQTANEELSQVQNDFVQTILKSFEVAAVHNFEPLVRAMTAAKSRFAKNFAEFPELVKIIISKLPDNKSQSNAEVGSILAEITPYISHELRVLLVESADKSIDEEKLMNRPTFILAMLDLLSQLRETEPNYSNLHELLIKFIITTREPQAIQILSGINWSQEEFKKLCVLIGRPLEQDFRQEFVPLIAESLGEYKDSFLNINNEDIAVKTIAYRDLQSVGEFNYVFAMQAFADMQISEFALQNAASGFLCRIINDCPELIEEFILPSIRFHVNKRNARIPVSEVIILFNSITAQKPDILPTITKLCQLDSFKSIGSVDEGVRFDGFLKFGDDIESMKDSLNREELSIYILPLLSQMTGATGLANALSPVCRLSSHFAIDKLLQRLTSNVERTATVQLLVDLCKQKAFTADQVTSTLLRLIEDKQTPNKAQLQLMTALLSINTKPFIIRRLINYVTNKALNKKQEIRKIGQEAITALTGAVSKEMFYDFFQSLRNQMSQGYGIPLLYVSLSNVIENSKIVGCFDPFIKVLVGCLLEDIFGNNAQLRVQMADRVPEAKKCHSFNSFEKLAGKIVFNETIRDIIDCLKERFEMLQSREQERGAKRLINSFCTGLLENETICADHIVIVAKEMLTKSQIQKPQKSSKKEEKKISYGHMFEQDLILEKPVRSSFEAQNPNTYSFGSNFLISYFAMKMLVVFFDNNLFIPDQEDMNENKESSDAQIKMLDDLLNDIWHFTTSTNDNDSMIISMTILEHYAHHDVFPTFNKKLPDIFDFIADQLQQMHTATDDFGKKIFALLTTILVNFPNIELPTKFTRALVQFSSDKLDDHDSCEQIFGVLILVVKRRNDIPEIYDVADRAFELIVRATSQDVRRLSADFCSIYLTTYKMKQISFENHIKFVLSNLQSNKSAARRSLIYFIRKFIEIAKEEQLEKYHELIFLYLGVTIANETDDGISKEIGEAISDLLQSNNSNKLQTDFELMTKWASSDGKQTRTGLLMLSVAVPLTNVESALDDLQQLVDARVGAENIKIKLAAIQLHKAIVSTFAENEEASVKLFNISQLLNLLSLRETTRIGCELCHWYLSDYQHIFSPSDEELIKLARELLRITFDWSGVIQESGLALSSIISRVDENNLAGFIPDMEKYTNENDPSQGAVILMMRAIAASVDQMESSEEEKKVPKQYLNFALKFIGKMKLSKNKEIKQAASGALSFLRRKIQPEVFAQEWAAIVEEEDKLKKERIEQSAADKLLDPEGLKKRRKEAKQLKKIEERKKKYLESDMFDGTLHPFGPDGKRVESIPLPPEFQSKK